MAKQKKQVQRVEKEFEDFNIVEYNMFLLLHFLIVLLVISAVGGSVKSCLEKFVNLLTPGSWF